MLQALEKEVTRQGVRAMGSRMAAISATSILALLLLTQVSASTPPVVEDVQIDGEVGLNNRVRYVFSTVEGAAEYEIYYSNSYFSNVSSINPPETSVAGFPDAWLSVSDEQGEDPTVEETLKFMRCWWSSGPLDEALSDIPISSNWSEPTFSSGMPLIPSQAYSIACDLPGIKRGQEVYIGVVAIGADESSVTEGLVVVSAITIAESAAPPKPNMMPVYIALGTIIGGLCLVVAVLYFLSPSRRDRQGYLLVLPSIILLATLTFYPVGYGIYLSFTDESASNYGQGEFVGLDNYELLFSEDRDFDGDGDPGFWRAFTFTLVWTFGCVSMHMLLGVLFALLLESRVIGKVAWRTILLIPWAVPGYISVIMWRGMLNRFGWVNGILTTDIDYLGWDSWAKFSVIFVNIWMGFSFMTMTVSGALQGIPKDMYEAASIDGVSTFRRFRHLTLPQLMPALVPLSLLGMIWTFNLFHVIFLMTGGGPDRYYGEPGVTDILVTFVYDVAFIDGEYGLAAAWSVIIFLMLIAFSTTYLTVTKGGEVES